MRKSIKAICTIIFVLFVLGVATFLLYFKWALDVPASSDTKQSLFEVKSGEGTFDIASRLKIRGFVHSDWIFFLDAKMKAKPLMAGIYNLSPNMTMTQIYDAISNGETDVIKITIPEGYRTEQIAQVLDANNLVKYDDFVAKAKPYEGKLFPDTYYFTPDNTQDEIIETMRDDFAQRSKDIKYTEEDLIIASIVEREAVKDEERPLIAGIYKNRIAKSMKLQADPTVQYGKDDQKILSLSGAEKAAFKFWSPITAADYQTINSPYNTYLIPELPPAPICNPGIKSLKATIDYQKSDYLFFLQDNGQIYPSATSAEHDKNRAKVLGVKLNR